MTTHAEPRPRTGALVETLPASYYTDPTILEIEQKEIFAKTWQYVGTVDALAKPGDYITTTLVDTPIIVSRSRDGVHAMVNVCRHRFSEVASGCGNTRAFKCPYHAWTYGLDGALRAAPRSDLEPCFERDARAAPGGGRHVGSVRVRQPRRGRRAARRRAGRPAGGGGPPRPRR